MSDFGIGSMINSARRMARGYQELARKGDPLMLQFLQRESSILLGRAIKVWWNLRFGRKRCNKESTNSSSSGDSVK